MVEKEIANTVCSNASEAGKNNELNFCGRNMADLGPVLDPPNPPIKIRWVLLIEIEREVSDSI